MDDASVRDFRKILDGLLKITKKLCALEKAIAEAASRNDTDELNRLVTGAQPDLMQFRGLDHKRLQFQERNGWKDMKLSDILAVLPPEGRNALSPVAENLEAELRLFQEARDAAETIMQVRLKDIQIALAGSPQPHAFHDSLA